MDAVEDLADEQHARHEQGADGAQFQRDLKIDVLVRIGAISKVGGQNKHNNDGKQRAVGPVAGHAP
jgi:hypothetical protein